MKVPPKRKGNVKQLGCYFKTARSLNESPSEKEGKSPAYRRLESSPCCLNESPSEKEGKFMIFRTLSHFSAASMKVPPKRKGNSIASGDLIHVITASMKVPPKRKGNSSAFQSTAAHESLNESPSEKEGKYVTVGTLPHGL